MQSEKRITLVPLRSLCSTAPSPRSTNDDASIAASMDLNSSEDMENFYLRCLLCTCRPDVTPHLNIFSEAGSQLQLVEKINKYLNIQIVSKLPQNVCHSCMEKLEVTHELVTSSQQASITLLQIKQQIEILDQKEVPMEVSTPGDQSANNLAVHSSQEHTDNKPHTSPLPDNHMDIENIFIKQEIGIEEFEPENKNDADVAKDVCCNTESTHAPHGTVPLERAHCSPD
ncbi:hypothetical protein B566_EDAN013231, partial [Ephemera danica]